MPDITICVNKKCPMFKMCGRSGHNNPQWGEWQSVSNFEPKSQTECEHKTEVMK